jgi:hypothetical protein
MILPDFILSGRVNQRWQYSGIDSLEQCLDPSWFKQYPHNVEYVYNSRGFRDQEWPDSVEELSNCVWCIGDSFTVGIGSPVEHTWPYLLQQSSEQRTINVSLDGASNNWIAKKILSLLQTVAPKVIAIHWSFFHRRELSYEVARDIVWPNFYQSIKDPSWPDCDEFKNFTNLPDYIKKEIHEIHKFNDQINDEARRVHLAMDTTENDIANTYDCIIDVERNKGSTTLIHSFIPNAFVGSIQSIKNLDIVLLNDVVQKDYARDGFHYGPITSQNLVNQTLRQL